MRTFFTMRPNCSPAFGTNGGSAPSYHGITIGTALAQATRMMPQHAAKLNRATDAGMAYARPRPERRNQASRMALLRRVHAEFKQLPCLRLTAAQTQRLLNLRADICARVLQELTTARLVYLADDGRYAARAE